MRDTTFKVTKWDYIILLAAMIVFLHGFFTIEFITIYDPNFPDGRPIGPGIKISMQVILAPLIILHRFFLILKGPNMTRLRYVDWKLEKALFWAKIKDKIDEGKQQHQEWKNNRH